MPPTGPLGAFDKLTLKKFLLSVRLVRATGGLVGAAAPGAGGDDISARSKGKARITASRKGGALSCGAVPTSPPLPGLPG